VTRKSPFYQIYTFSGVWTRDHYKVVQWFSLVCSVPAEVSPGLSVQITMGPLLHRVVLRRVHSLTHSFPTRRIPRESTQSARRQTGPSGQGERGGTGLVGLLPGLVVGQGRLGGRLRPGRLIWVERRWQIFCRVRICEGKAVFRKYAFVAGTRVPSGARAYWAGRPAEPRTVTVQHGPRMRVGRWASCVEKGEEGQAEIEEGLGSCLNGI
jgi:hypothetical protein